jgi:nicotinate-nucleotide adenylyltransferase
MIRVGLLGGAFNPPHHGHLRLARLALATLDLDELRVVPTALSPHKPTTEGPSDEVRLRLIEEAFAGLDARCVIEPLELQRGGASYTVDTLEALCLREPDARWILIMGSDQWQAFPSWRNPSRILELASLAVAPRPGHPLISGQFGLVPSAAWSGRPGEWLWLPSTDLDLASTTLRSELKAKVDPQPAGLPDPVLGIIRSEKLYR